MQFIMGFVIVSCLCVVYLGHHISSSMAASLGNRHPELLGSETSAEGVCLSFNSATLQGETLSIGKFVHNKMCSKTKSAHNAQITRSMTKKSSKGQKGPT